MRRPKWAQQCRILDNARYSIAAKTLILARPEGLEPPAPWFEGRHSITRKSMIFNSIHYSNRLIFPQDTSL